MNFVNPVKTFVNPEGTPSIYASKEEWAAYRELQALARSFSGVNNSGMTPQQIEAMAGVPSLTNAATIGSYINDPTYTEPAVNRPPNQAFTPSGPAINEKQSIMELAFPEIFLKTPPTGEVDTTFGVERVNARTSETGARAFKDAKGNVTLTNLGADGQKMQGAGSANSILGDGIGNSISAAPDSPVALNSAINQLRSATNLATAQGIMININETIAQQVGKMQEEALTFATNKVGLPNLEAELQAAITADQLDPLYVQGMGDSPITAKIRTDIQQANQSATAIAQKYLQSNTRMGSLKAMEDNAKLIYDSVKRNEEFTLRRSEMNNNANMQRDLGREARKEDQIDRENRKISDEIGPLNPDQIRRMSILDSSVRDTNGNIDTLGAQKAAWALKKRNPQKFQEAIDKPLMELPVYAMLGNEFAANIVVADELGKNPSVTETMVREKLNRIKSVAISLTEKQVEEFSLSQTPVADRASLKEVFKQKRLDAAVNTPKGDRLKMLEQEKFYVALQMERAAVSNRILSEAGSIFTMDGPLGPAMAEAQKVTGKRALLDVFTAYKGFNAQLNAVQAAKQFNDIVRQQIDNQPESAFGRPNSSVVMAALINSQRNILMEFLSKTVRTPPMLPILQFGAEMTQSFIKSQQE